MLKTGTVLKTKKHKQQQYNRNLTKTQRNINNKGNGNVRKNKSKGEQKTKRDNFWATRDNFSLEKDISECVGTRSSLLWAGTG